MQTLTITHPGIAAPVDLAVEDVGRGVPFLLLHGGAGPASFAPFAAYLAEQRPARAIVPTHPGFHGTPRPDAVADVPTLAALYVALLDRLDLRDVIVVGSSIGGWIAAEIALLASPRVCGVVIMNAAGLAVPGHPVADVFSLTPDELTRLSYHDRHGSALILRVHRRAEGGADRQPAALAIYGGRDMADPTLAARLAAVTVPTLVLWGQSDGVVGPTTAARTRRPYRAHRTAGVQARHLPQIESPTEPSRRSGTRGQAPSTGDDSPNDLL
jgi:pimeloyl-ACP methyl ester carboxylesterase